MLAMAILAGYWLRFRAPVPELVRDASGSICYVLAGAIVIRWAIPQAGAFRPALAAFVLTCIVEFLQLWKPPALAAARRTLPGRLVLGTDFAWEDFPAYAAGFLLSWWILQLTRRRAAAASPDPVPPPHPQKESRE